MFKFTAAGIRAAGLPLKFTPKRKENGFEDIESFWEAAENIVLPRIVDDSEYLNSSSTISVTEDEDEDTEAELEAEFSVPQKLIEDSDLSVSLPFEDDSSGADEEQEKSSNDDYEEDSAVDLPKQNETSFNNRDESDLSQSLSSRRRRHSSDMFSPIKDTNNTILQSRRTAKFTNTKSPFTAKESPVSTFGKVSPNAYSIGGKSPKSTPRHRSQEISDIYDYPVQSPSFTRNKSRTREEEFGDNEDNLDVDDEEEDDEVETESLHHSRHTSLSTSRSKITSPSTSNISKYSTSSPSPSSIKSNSKSYSNKKMDVSAISSLPAYEESSYMSRTTTTTTTTTTTPKSSSTSPSGKSRNNVSMEDISKLTSFTHSMNEKTFNSHLDDDDDDNDNTNNNDDDNDYFDNDNNNIEEEEEEVEVPQQEQQQEEEEEEAIYEEEFSTPVSKKSNPSLKQSSSSKLLTHSSRRVSFSKDTSPKPSKSANNSHNNSNSSFTPMSPIKMTSPNSSKMTSPNSSKMTSPNSSKMTSPNSSKMTSPNSSKMTSPNSANRPTPNSTTSHYSNKSSPASSHKVQSPSPKKNKDIMDTSRNSSEKKKSANKANHQQQQQQVLSTPQSQILQNRKNKDKKASNRAYYSFDLSTPKTGEFVRGTAIPDESYRDDDEGTGGDYDGDVLVNSDGEEEEEEGNYDDSGFTDTSYLQSIRKKLQNGKRVAASGEGEEDGEVDSADNSYLNNTTMDNDDDDDDVHTSREEASDKKLRRSRRVTKGKTFQFWKNEGPVYREGRIQGWVTHDPTPKKNSRKTSTTTTTTNNNTKRKKGSSRLLRELDLGQDEEEEIDHSFIGNDHDHSGSTGTPASSNRHKKQKLAPPREDVLPVVLPNNRQFKTLDEVDELKIWNEDQVAVTSMNVTCARPTDASYAPLPITADRPASELDKIAYATHLFNTPGVPGQMSGWISGILKLPPGGIKDEEGVGECSQVFHVLSCQEGSVELGISDPEEDIWDETTARRLLLKANDTFFIPRGNIYRLENHSLRTECFIFWTIIKPVHSAGEEGSNEEEEEESEAPSLRAN